MSLKYKIYSDRNLFVDVLESQVHYSDLERLFILEIVDGKFDGVTKVLSNIMNSEFAVSFDDVQKFIKLMIDPTRKKENFRWATLESKPNHTALSIIIQEKPFFAKIVGVFSTLEACNKFLNISFDSLEFDDADYLALN